MKFEKLFLWKILQFVKIYLELINFEINDILFNRSMSLYPFLGIDDLWTGL